MENYINFDPMAWAGLPEQPANVNEAKAPSVEPAAAEAATTDDWEKILAVGQELLAMGANIAESYSDWIRLGFALADGLGSQGRDLYHQLSALSGKYSEPRCEKQWKECLAKGNGAHHYQNFLLYGQAGRG